jgi:hypothetical protein
MKTRKPATLVYSGKKLQAVKQSSTQQLVGKYYALSQENSHKAKMEDAWRMYSEFKLKVALRAAERGLI